MVRCLHKEGECALCREQGITENKVYRCKWCKVEVVSKTNPTAILGHTHGKHCPRRFK